MPDGDNLALVIAVSAPTQALVRPTIGGRVQSTSATQLATMAEVSIKLLGGFSAAAAGEPLDDASWRLRKGRDLVKLLALAPGHRMHREQLMFALWPDREPAAAANNLNQVVHAARRVLGPPAIELREELLTLHASVDVEQFERGAAQAREARSAGAYRAALALYGGELLPENRYEDWARERREKLEELRRELEEELRRLGPGRAAIGTLPTRASSFIGREHELDELAALLYSSRLLTLAGAGGAGKTRLALELARRSEGEYADGAAVVELAGVREGTLVVHAAAVALDVASLPSRSPLEGIVDFLAARNALLVLDNCEHLLAPSASLCDELLRAAPALTILATTREPLRAEGEVVFRVPSLAIPDPERGEDAEQLMRYEAVRLLADRASAAVPGFAVDAENARDVARICFRLDGLPLALELAAARLGGLGTSALAERLDDRFRLLRTDSRPAPTRQQTLLATLQWSHDLLNVPEQVLLRRLAVFAGGFELPAAEAVCADSQLPSRDDRGRARTAGREVARRRRCQSARVPRYQLLESVRLLRASAWLDAGERDASRSDTHAGRWRWPSTRTSRPQLDSEAANLRVGARPALTEERLRSCAALCRCGCGESTSRSAHRRCQKRSSWRPHPAEPAPMPCSRPPRSTIAPARSGAAKGTCARHTRSAKSSATPALRWRRCSASANSRSARDEAAPPAGTSSRPAGSPAERASRRRRRCRCTRWASPAAAAGDLDGAEQLIDRSAAALRSLAGERGAGALAAERLADASRRPLRPRHAVDRVRGHSAAFRRDLPGGDSSLCARQPGHDRAPARRDAAAHRLFDEAAGPARAAEGRTRARRALVGPRLPRARDRGGRAARTSTWSARSRCGRGCAIARGAGMVMVGLGLVGIQSGEHDLAEEQLGQARELFRRAGDRWGLVSALWRTAELALARMRLDDAQEALEAARATVVPTERRGWIDVTVAMLAEVAALRGEEARAEALFAQARESLLEAGDEAAVAAVDARAQMHAKNAQSRRKAAGGITAPATTTNRRRH